MTWFAAVVAAIGVPVAVFWWRVLRAIWARLGPILVPELRAIFGLFADAAFVTARWTLYALRHRSLTVAARLVSHDFWLRSWRRAL